MNAAGTMARVYQALKARVIAGEFAPGERVDPARLSVDLAASATPIRDALHRLAGERLVENWQHEGFRLPIVTEATLRDQYAWSDDLVRTILRAVERGGNSTETDAPAITALTAIEFFQWLATLSPNHEHRAALAGLNDRCHAVRLVERRLLAAPDFASPIEAIAAGRFVDARRWSAAFHAARIRNVADLAACFRPREA